jgi:hypothetical protein
LIDDHREFCGGGVSRTESRAFIASDEASKVTGALIFAGGGTTIAEGGAGRGAKDFVER